MVVILDNILGLDISQFQNSKIIFFFLESLRFKTYVWILFICFLLVWLQRYDKNGKRRPFLDAILNFGESFQGIVGNFSYVVLHTSLDLSKYL